MPDKIDLVLDIARTHPQALARYLEAHPPSATCSLLDAASGSAAAKLLEAMLPHYAAKCLECRPAETAANLLSTTEARFAAAILRHMRDAPRRAAIGSMAPHAAARIAILLRYSPAVVGAWLNPTIVVLPSTARVAEAKARIAADGYADYHRVYVVDAAHRPTGFVHMYRLLQGDGTGHLSEFVEPLPPPLLANMSLDLALDHEGWRVSDYLPVLDRAGRLVGIVRYADLRAATKKAQPRAAEDALSGTLMELAETCYLGMADVMNTSLASESPASLGERS